MLLSAAAPSAEALASFQGNQVAQTAEYSELLGFDPARVMNAKTGSKVAPQAYQTPTATPVGSKGVDPAVKNMLVSTALDGIDFELLLHKGVTRVGSSVVPM